MPLIKVIDEADADDLLSEAYRKVGRARGRVANILKIHSIHPEALIAHFDLYRELMFGHSDLTRAEREMIAVAVSSVNDCHY
jgi:uncharacterized peroxidase-related enzyme